MDQIVTVLPDDADQLAIDPEQDYCTLATCTPYGVNSHRLLVRGHRIETPQEETPVHIISGARQIGRAYVAACAAVPIALILLCVLVIVWLFRRRA